MKLRLEAPFGGWGSKPEISLMPMLFKDRDLG